MMAEARKKKMPRGKPFQKGQGGRMPGVQNKITRTVKETVLAVFNDLQSDRKANLKSWAVKETTEFYRLAAKLIPTEISGKVKQTITLNIVRSSTNNTEQASPVAATGADASEEV